MTTPAAAKEQSPQASRRRFAPRFSLAAALVAMTLCAVGLWYWFRVPFEVEHQISKSRREVETVRRTWGGTIRHGPRRVFDGDKLLFAEDYRDGMLHGRWEWFDGTGKSYLTAEFRRGKIVSFHASPECDQRLARLLAEGQIDNGLTVIELMQPTSCEFVATPLKDATQILIDIHQIPITCQGLRKRVTIKESAPAQFPAMQVIRVNDPFDPPFDPKALATHIRLEMLAVKPQRAKPPRIGPQYDLPITAKADGAPLIVMLGKMLQPHGLVCDYRYGMLWIAERQEAETWQDPTGVSEIEPPPSSALARTWETRSPSQFIYMPLRPACEMLSSQSGGIARFDWSRLPPEFQDSMSTKAIVTLNVDQPFKHTLGMILEQVGCRARLEGETIVIELQPGHPSGPP